MIFLLDDNNDVISKLIDLLLNTKNIFEYEIRDLSEVITKYLERIDLPDLLEK